MIRRLRDAWRTVRRPRQTARAVARRLSVVETLAGREVVAGVPLPLSRRLSLWRHGFTSRSGVLFGVGPGSYDDYLSDYRLELLDDLGGDWADVPANKLAGHLWFGASPEYLPALYGVVDDGRLYRDYPTVVSPPTPGLDAGTRRPDSTDGAGRGSPGEAGEWVASVLDETGTLVCKPAYGFGGEGVHVCRATEDGVVVDGDRRSRGAFVEWVDGLTATLVTEYVEQADYAARLFPDAVNTLRVLTLWDPETDEPFVADAVQRIGTQGSAPVDNWSRGGLSAAVRADGTLSAGARWEADETHLAWYDSHPDTGTQIAGTTVPDWPEIRAGVLELARTVPYLPRVGWDVVVTGDGEFVLLELNGHAGIETLQVHRPHLDDPRVRRVYEAHGAI
jgi:hypothetical protein